jgi:hypothetical protein
MSSFIKCEKEAFLLKNLLRIFKTSRNFENIKEFKFK